MCKEPKTKTLKVSDEEGTMSIKIWEAEEPVLPKRSTVKESNINIRKIMQTEVKLFMNIHPCCTE